MRTTLLFFFLLLAGLVSAQTIESPTFKARAGSVNTITKIERTPEATKLYIHAVFRPHWWIKPGSDEYLEDVATGKEYMITGSEGIELDKETYMSESGEMDFVLLFAPLPKETTEIHWLQPGSVELNTYNISLVAPDKKNKNPLEGIKGNWLTDDAFNEWAFGIYDSLVIMDNHMYGYENIREKGKKIELTLKDKQNGNTEIINLTLLKNRNCLIQKNNDKKKRFTREDRPLKTIRPEADFAQFFNPDSACLQGYIRGYDPRIGFETALIPLSNIITNEDNPTVVTINPDGSFLCKFKIDHPIGPYLRLSNNYIPFYIEPGQTTTMYVDWEAIMARSRSRDIYFPIRNTLYMGLSAEISQLLNNCQPLLRYYYEQLSQQRKELSPEQFKEKQKPLFARWDQISDSLASIYQPSTKAIHLLKNEVSLKKGRLLLEFVMDRDYYARQDTANQILKIKENDAYYDFLKDMPLNDITTLALETTRIFINRFEFIAPLEKALCFFQECHPDSVLSFYDEKPLLSYLKENGIQLNAAQEKLRRKQEELAGQVVVQNKAVIEAEDLILEDIDAEALENEYRKKYGDINRQNELDRTYVSYKEPTMQKKDSIIDRICGFEQPFLWQVAKVRSLYSLKNIQSDILARRLLNSIEKKITDPFLLNEAENIYRKIHPEKTIETYQLPAGKATDIFRRIIKAHQGKVLYIDFWATSCAPCRAGIEHTAYLRQKYRNHPEFQFIYITSVEESPEETYNKYIEKNLKGEACYRISETEFSHLRELFHFDGIPHYELIEKDGSVSSKCPESRQLDSFLDKRFKTTEK